MALNFKGTSNNALACMKKLGVKDEMIQWLSATKWDVKLTAHQFTFSKDGKQHTVPTMIETLIKLSENKLPVGEALHLTNQIQFTIKNLDGWGDMTVTTEEPKEEITLTDVLLKAKAFAGQKHSGIVVVDEPGPTVVEAKGWPTFDLGKLKSATPAKLRDATKMYQPVHGTSPGSRYFVVGANADLRVAARLHSNTLSVRIEGPSWEKHKAGIAQVGFNTVDTTKGYASVHLAVGDDLTTANKTLGAILMGLGVPLETPIPNLKVIKEA